MNSAPPPVDPAPPSGPADEQGLHPSLRDAAHRVSPRAPWVWGVGAFVRALVLVGFVIGLDRFTTWTAPVWLWPVLGVASIAYAVGMPLVRYRVHRWESTDTAVYTQTGFISRERRIAPMSRVQTVDFEQGPISRLVGLASVTVTTASALGPLHIEGISKATADQLVQDLSMRAEAEVGDAT